MLYGNIGYFVGGGGYNVVEYLQYRHSCDLPISKHYLMILLIIREHNLVTIVFLSKYVCVLDPNKWKS